MASNCPIPTTRLTQIANDACNAALSTAGTYDHAATAGWNNAIITHILKALISESTPAAGSSATATPQFKFAVNSTIIQHLSDPRSSGGDGNAAGDGVSLGADDAKKVGRRGMHSASGAFWNNEKDGMWSFKYEGGLNKGMDIVISVIWVAV